MTVQEKLRLGITASRNAIFSMVLLALVKGSVGLYSGSTALLADAVHTAMDVFTSLAVWIGLKVSLKSGGESFPYGYYKAENIVALFVSLIILLSGVELLREGLAGIKAPSELQFEGLALATSVFSVLGIYALSVYKARIGNLINSQALIADARHSYTDVFASLVVVAAVLGSMFGVPQLDSFGAIVISFLIFKLGLESARDAMLILMDAWLDRETNEKIRQNIENIPGLLALKDLKLRKSGLVVFGEATVEIEGDPDLKQINLLSESVERAVRKEVENLEHLAVNARAVERKRVRFALPVFGNEGLSARLSEHLGKAPYFLFADVEARELRNWKVLENPASDIEKKRGVKTVEFLLQEKANALVLSSVGEGPFHMLRDNLVRIYRTPDGVETALEILDRIEDLEEIEEPE